MKYLQGLNPQQIEAVKYNSGPMLLLAGAGAGKTKTLISKIAYLINEEGYLPHTILAVTFTNKAAGEMKHRLTQYLNPSVARSVTASTFHSLCARLLRNHASLVGLKHTFSIYDDSESNVLLKRILEEANVDKDEVNAGSVSHFIDEVKNKGHYRQQPAGEWKDHKFYKFFLSYEKALEDNNAVDFNSLITKMIQLLENHEDVREHYHNMFQYIMVDEFQDTNGAQLELIKLLVNSNNRVCVIGDIDQSIYSFRYADVDNMMNFDRFFPGTKEFKLEANYRSTKTIVDAATTVIKKNLYRKDKTMFTTSGEGEKIRVYECYDGKTEANFVAQEIQKLLRKNVEPKEIAVFYRNNSQSRAPEEAFRMMRIPYELIGGQRFYERKEIKDMLAYMRLMVNSSDNISLLRVINTPARGIGDKAQETLLQAARGSNKNVLDIILDGDFKNLKLSVKIKDALDNLQAVYHQASGMTSSSLLELYEHFLEGTGYEDYLKKSKKVEDQARLDNLREFKSSLRGLTMTLQEFLESVTLNQEQEDVSKDERVKLMTVHAAKGLEFEYVFVLGLEEGIFPSPQSVGKDLEEERRLFYVAMTRAKKELNLFHANSRLTYGQFVSNPKSRFIYEIPHGYCRFFRI